MVAPARVCRLCTSTASAAGRELGGDRAKGHLRRTAACARRHAQGSAGRKAAPGSCARAHGLSAVVARAPSVERRNLGSPKRGVVGKQRCRTPGRARAHRVIQPRPCSGRLRATAGHSGREARCADLLQFNVPALGHGKCSAGHQHMPRGAMCWAAGTPRRRRCAPSDWLCPDATAVMTHPCRRRPHASHAQAPHTPVASDCKHEKSRGATASRGRPAARLQVGIHFSSGRCDGRGPAAHRPPGRQVSTSRRTAECQRLTGGA